MPEVTIFFLYFEGCPLAPDMRANLADAIDLLESRMRIHLVELDFTDPDTPDYVKRWGSPTILINGKELTGSTPGSASSCRIYPGEGGVPTRDEIARAITAGVSA